jgi:hypothetical protein
MIVILKPRFLPCVYVKSLEGEEDKEGKSEVKLFGKTIEVETKDIKPARLPIFRKD